MQGALFDYFQGEKQAGLLLAGLGVIGVVAAAIFYPSRWDIRSFAITLGVLGLVQLAIGVGLYLKTGPQVEGLVAQLDNDAVRFYADEGVRMIKVQRNFVMLEIAWVILIVVTAVTAVVMKQRFPVTGVALGLLIAFSVILGFDLIAERRGAAYLEAIEANRARAVGK